MDKKINFTKANLGNYLRNNKWWHIALLIILPAVIYIQSVRFDYTNFDDNEIIKNKFEIVGNIKKIGTAIKRGAFFRSTGDFYRPVQNVSFMLDAQVSGQKLWMFHLTNLIIHILTCIALYYFLQLLTLKRFTAFILALLFAVHPLFASDIGWVPARADVLIGLEGILLFFTFSNYFTKNKPVIWFIIHSIIFFGTLFTKETTILFPLLLLYYYFMILRSPPHFNTIKNSIKKLLPFIIVWSSISILFLLLYKKVAAHTRIKRYVVSIVAVLKNSKVIPTIIAKFFVPMRLSTLPLFDNTSTIIGSIFLCIILYATFKYTVAKKWAVLMGLLWFLFFLIPPAIMRMKNADVYFNYLEHRAYLPMIGIIIMLGFFLNEKLSLPVFNKYFIRVYVPVIFLLSVLAFIHCADYKNQVTLADRAAKLNNPSALSARAGDLLDKGDTVGAQADINSAINLSNADPDIFFNCAKVLAQMQQYKAAIDYFDKAIDLDKNFAGAYFQRGNTKQKINDLDGACKDWNQALRLGYTDTMGVINKYCKP